MFTGFVIHTCKMMIYKFCLYQNYSDALSNTFPFAKESPFLVPMMTAFGKMQRFGVLDHIWKNYFSSGTAQHIKCGDPKVLTLSLVEMLSA